MLNWKRTLLERVAGKARGKKAEERLYSYCCWTVRRVLRKEWACLMGKVRPEAKRARSGAESRRERSSLALALGREGGGGRC